MQCGNRPLKGPLPLVWRPRTCDSGSSWRAEQAAPAAAAAVEGDWSVGVDLVHAVAAESIRLAAAAAAGLAVLLYKRAASPTGPAFCWVMCGLSVHWLLRKQPSLIVYLVAAQLARPVGLHMAASLLHFVAAAGCARLPAPSAAPVLQVLLGMLQTWTAPQGDECQSCADDRSKTDHGKCYVHSTKPRLSAAVTHVETSTITIRSMLSPSAGWQGPVKGTPFY